MTTLIWLIEDDVDVTEVILRELKRQVEGIDIRGFEAASEALGASGSPDIILCDVAGMTVGIGVNLACLASPIHSLMEKHTSAAFGLYSAIDVWAEDIVEEIKADNPDATVERVTWPDGSKGELDSFVEFIQRNMR